MEDLPAVYEEEEEEQEPFYNDDDQQQQQMDVVPDGPQVTLYPLEHYTFGAPSSLAPSKSRTRKGFWADRMARYKRTYEREGTRQTVAVVLLSHFHRHPMLLLLRHKDPDNPSEDNYSLPTNRVRAGQDVVECVKMCLQKRVMMKQGGDDNNNTGNNSNTNWPILAYLGKLYRPEFDKALFPYCPPHVSMPKEVISLYLLQGPERDAFACSPKYEMVAIPLVDLYKDARKYGDILASIPLFLSRCSFVYED